MFVLRLNTLLESMEQCIANEIVFLVSIYCQHANVVSYPIRMVPIDTIIPFPIEGVLSNKFDSPIPDLLNAGATFDII